MLNAKKAVKNALEIAEVAVNNDTKETKEKMIEETKIEKNNDDNEAIVEESV